MLDTGYTEGGWDGFGYATFGRVLRGMRVVEKIQSLPTGAIAAMPWLMASFSAIPLSFAAPTGSGDHMQGYCEGY